MLFKILHNLVELCLPNYIAYNTSATRGHKYKLSITFSRVDVYKHSLFPSTIPKCNSLSASTVEVASVGSFVDLLWNCCTLIIWAFAIVNIIIIIEMIQLDSKFVACFLPTCGTTSSPEKPQGRIHRAISLKYGVYRSGPVEATWWWSGQAVNHT